MNSSGRLESAVSIVILAVLFLTGTGIFIKQSHYNTAQVGSLAVSAGLSAQQSQSNEKEKPVLASLAADGFTADPKIEIYNPDTLYEKIDGKAPFYIDAGFRKLFSRRFVSKKDENVGMELYLYNMGGAKNAFSVWSTQKREDAQDLPEPQFAYRTSNALYFVHGKYYIEFIGFSESDELFKTMTEISRRLRANLAIDSNDGITELSLLPQENLVPGSIKYYLTGAFGSENLTDVYTARYKLGDQTVTAFISKRSAPRDAETIAGNYRKFLIDNGAAVKPAINKILENKVFNFYDATEIVFAAGPFVAGVHEAENQQAAEKLAALLFDKLTEAAKSVK